MSAERRSHKDDSAISDWLRNIGGRQGAPCVNLDFVACHYNQERPVALVEHKHANGRGTYERYSGSSLRTLATLGDMAGLPAFLLVYDDALDWFDLSPLNEIGRKYVRGETRLSPRGLVALIYSFSGRVAEPELLARYSGEVVSRPSAEQLREVQRASDEWFATEFGL